MTSTIAEFTDDFVGAHPAILEKVTQKDLQQFWGSFVGVDLPAAKLAYEQFEDVFLHSLSGESRTALQFHAGGWEINVSEGMLKGVLCGALLGGILTLAGLPELPALILPAILPILFDTKQVRLTKSEKHVLASLTLRDEVRSNKHSPNVLYDMLPPEIRHELSRLDFLNFLEKCRAAGVADHSEDDTVVLRPAETPKFRITIT